MTILPQLRTGFRRLVSEFYFRDPSILLRFASQAAIRPSLARFLLRYAKMLGGDNPTVKEITGKSCRSFRRQRRNRQGF
ncbi:MAG TPA: hypothetical protein DC058_23815 [Planctomycetaceae bacterium]|nr:hypothetical protein [Planctomycetaceae bacterium]